jgi:hypothetical protein
LRSSGDECGCHAPTRGSRRAAQFAARGAGPARAGRERVPAGSSDLLEESHLGRTRVERLCGDSLSADFASAVPNWFRQVPKSPAGPRMAVIHLSSSGRVYEASCRRTELPEERSSSVNNHPMFRDGWHGRSHSAGRVFDTAFAALIFGAYFGN